MLSPFFISYVPLVNYWIHLGSFGIYQHGHRKIWKCKKIFGYLALFPIFLVYLTIMDLLYLIETVFLHPLSLIIAWLSCGTCKLSLFSNSINTLYTILFDMNENDIEGFRRLRTISQMLFESIPQTLLQIRMVHYFMIEFNDPKELERIGVDFSSICLSLLFAIIHIIIELEFLALDSKACMTTRLHYIIICMNGRFGWVPFTHKFQSTYICCREEQALLDYDDIKSKLCGLKLKVFFKFDVSTCENLIKAISTLPVQSDAANRLDIKIGHSIDEVNFDSFLNLLDIGYQRVNLDILDVNIKFMIENSQGYKTPITAKTDQISTEMITKWQKILEKMVIQGYYHMVKTLVKLGVQISDKDAVSYFKIAMNQKDSKMVQILLRLNKKQVLEQSHIYVQRFLKTIVLDKPYFYQQLEGKIQLEQIDRQMSCGSCSNFFKQKERDISKKYYDQIEYFQVDDVEEELMKFDISVSQEQEQVQNIYWYLFMSRVGNLQRLQFLQFLKEQVRLIYSKTIEIKMKSGWFIDGFIFCNYLGQELHSCQDQGGDWGKGLQLQDGEYCIKIDQWVDENNYLTRALFTLSQGRKYDFRGEKYQKQNIKGKTIKALENQFITSVTQPDWCQPVQSATFDYY